MRIRELLLLLFGVSLNSALKFSQLVVICFIALFSKDLVLSQEVFSLLSQPTKNVMRKIENFLLRIKGYLSDVKLYIQLQQGA